MPAALPTFRTPGCSASEEYEIAGDAFGLPHRQGRYITEHGQHGSQWNLLRARAGKTGSASRACGRWGSQADILMIPLLMVHTRDIAASPCAQGRLAAACRRRYFFHGQIQTPPVRAPLVLGLFQRRADIGPRRTRPEPGRCGRSKAAHGSEVTISTAMIRSIRDCRFGSIEARRALHLAPLAASLRGYLRPCWRKS